jgi:autotransporter adhesin
VSGVAAGSVAQGSTDAVNGGQVFALSQQLGVGLGAMTKRLDALDTRIAQLGFDLRKFRRDANSGIATAVALGALPQATNPGRWAVGMGTGLRDGQLAIAAGASWRSPNDVFVVNLRAGYDEASFTAGAGFGMEF